MSQTPENTGNMTAYPIRHTNVIRHLLNFLRRSENRQPTTGNSEEHNCTNLYKESEMTVNIPNDDENDSDGLPSYHEILNKQYIG